MCTPPEKIGSTNAIASRSEEHTSELQSQSNLVCRLLLEKKKKKRDCLNLHRSITRTTLDNPEPPLQRPTAMMLRTHATRAASRLIIIPRTSDPQISSNQH